MAQTLKTTDYLTDLIDTSISAVIYCCGILHFPLRLFDRPSYTRAAENCCSYFCELRLV